MIRALSRFWRKSMPGLGRKEHAISEGRHAVDLMPISKDAYDGPLLLQGLAQVLRFGREKTSARWNCWKNLCVFPAMSVTAISCVIRYGILCAAIGVSRKSLPRSRQK
jgi:hypothetical protein